MMSPNANDQSAADERRRAQNRLAQRRHRQRQALKKQAALQEVLVIDHPGMMQADLHTGEGFSLFDGTGGPGVLDSLSSAPTACDLAIPSWDLTPWDSTISTLPAPTGNDGLEPPEMARMTALNLSRTVARGHQPNSVFANDRGETLVHTAARANDVATLRLLAQAGCDLDGRDLQGKTALHAAYEDHGIEAIVWLLEQGVNVDAEDNQGRTMLSMAVNAKCPAAVRLLLSHGASPSAKQTEKVQLLSVGNRDF